MTDQDLPAFMDVFRDLALVYNIRQESERLGSSYFKVLRFYPLNFVALGAEKCKGSLTRFPKPAEWKQNIPKPTAPGVPEMTHDEASDHQEAERFFYELPPCSCSACKAAFVSTLPRRYVPDEGDPRARIGDRMVTRGHWAHGQELKAYYTAKDAFWTKARAKGLRGNILNPPERKVLAGASTFERIVGEEG